MPFEIERKFLVSSTDFKTVAYQKLYIKQGFISSSKYYVVRVRLINNLGFLTIKGPSNKKGTTRFEWEKQINTSKANSLFKLCQRGIIEKNRYLVKVKTHTFEVDEFLSDNKGLLIAEIELTHENENFVKPNWLGKEVTGINKYYNSSLSKFPYNQWHHKN